MRKLPNMRVLLKQGERVVRSNSPVILAGLACGGVVGTAYLAHQAGYRSGREELHFDPWKERIKVWRRYIPPVVVGAVTIGCIVTGNRVGTRRTAAMAAAYSVSERAFSEYREKVEEKFGKTKETAVRDEIAQDTATKASTGGNVILLGAGTVICYEYFTGRHFLCDMETLKRAQNDLNYRLLQTGYAALSDFHFLIGQPTTPGSEDMGWTSDRQLDLEFSSCLWDESRPALEFRYNYLKPL